MQTTQQDSFQDIREAVRDLCQQFSDEYFRKVDEARGYPEAFVDALTKAGWLAALIPQEFGGSGLGLTRSVGHHGRDQSRRRQFGRVPRSDVQHGHAAAPRLARRRSSKYLPKIASGELRLQSMGVTEPTTGTDTTKIKTTAERRGDRYVINGQKVWISRVQHSDLMILLARTTPLSDVKKKSEGMSIFIVDLREAIGQRPDRAADSRTWSITRPTNCSSTTSKSPPRI